MTNNDIESPVYDFDGLQSRVTRIRSGQIFFVCGVMKSGTTWVQLLLDAHPNISCNGEGHFMDVLADYLANALDHYNEYIDNKNLTLFDQISRIPKVTTDHLLHILTTSICLLLDQKCRDKKLVAIGEKTPDNASGLQTLALLFPNAKFIHVVRDGRDCAVSGWFHNLRLDQDRTIETYASLDHYAIQFAETWASVVKTASEFGQTVPGRYMTVRYEDLSTDTAAELARFFTFLGAKSAGPEIEHCAATASFTALTGGRRSGEENQASFFRKGIIGDWRNHLSPDTQQAFDDKAGDWLKHFGYS